MRFRHTTFSALTAFALMVVVFHTQLSAEFVFHKDGSIIEGSILSDTDKSVIVITKDKKQKLFPREKIIRILYGKLKTGKVYIQKRDGEGITAFVVDKDQDSYTFRNDLYKPEEFTLNRSDVLFMAEKNPSGLKVIGEIGTDRVSLAWYPPYDEVEKYNIYIKKDKDEKFELIESTKSKSVTLKGLTSNTIYFLKVTGVDTDEYESSPSRELKITTKNIPPDEPVITATGEIKSDERTLVWDAAVDPDGKVEKYRVYGTKDDKRVMIAEIKKTEYVLKKSLSYDKVEIAAVDERGDESETANVKLYEIDNILAFTPGLIMPIGDFGEMGEIGYGGVLSYMKKNIFIDDLTAGLEIGYYHIPGKNSLPSNGQNIHRMNVFTGTVKTGYEFEVSDYFFITPAASFGAAYLDLTYTSKDKVTEKSARGIDPMGAFSISFDYILSDYFFIGIMGSYGMLFEKTRIFQYVSCGINTGVRF